MAYCAVMVRLSRRAGLRVFRVYGRALEREAPARRLRAWSSYAAGAYRLRFFVPQ